MSALRADHMGPHANDTSGYARGRATGWALALALAGCSAPTPSPADAGDVVVPDADAAPVSDATTDATHDGPTDPPGEPRWFPCALRPGRGITGAQCAVVDAPLDHEQPARGRIELALKRIPARGAPAGQIWFVHGGPGASAVDGLATLARTLPTVLRDWEFLAVDHRGTGASVRLECPAQQGAGSDGGATITEDEWPACVAYLRARYGDALPYLSTTQSARDLATLVARLRRPGRPVFVYGGSYGTYLVQRYLRIAPEPPTGVLLEGVAPATAGFDRYDAEMNAVAEQFMGVCRATPACAARLGADPWDEARRIVASFDAGHCPGLGVDAAGVRRFLGPLLIYAATRDYVPALLYRMRRCEPRDVAALGSFARVVSGALGASGPAVGLDINDGAGRSTALFFHVALSEMWHRDGALPDPAVVRRDWSATTMATGLTVALAQRQTDWPVYPRDAHVGQLPLDYRGPALVLQGGLDAATTSPRAALLRPVLQGPAQTWVEFPTAAHEVMDATPTASGEDCARAVVLQFLRAPEAPLDATCVAAVRGPAFDGTPATNRALFGTDTAWDD